MKSLSPLTFFAGLAGIAATASAQIGSYIWQISDDNGASWNSVLFAPANPVKVRLLASFSGVSGEHVAVAGGQFDGTLIATGGRVGTISNIARVSPFTFGAQSFASREFSGGSTVKIDLPTDTALPGAGNGWVTPGQLDFQGAPEGTYCSDNPAVIFTYDLNWEGNSTDISMVLNPANGRAMAIFTSALGSTLRLNPNSITIIPAHIEAPSPSSLSLLSLGILATSRRRSNQRRC